MDRTPRCRMTLRFAEESQKHFSHPNVTSAHLLLGLLKLEGGVACNVLCHFGLSIRCVETYLSSPNVTDEDIVTAEDVKWGRSGFAAMQRGEAEAASRKHTYLGTEHLLLGILGEENGLAADLFQSLSIDSKTIKKSVEAELQT